MSLSHGVRLGAYEVLSLIGAGGMGEVYRARDTKLNRDVALKILPESFALDPDRLARFKREAHLLASLNHPNIAAIYGLEESGGVQALVLELVEGPTLADRIAQGPIPLDEALPIARQIAEALEAAHEQGMIHRDLKPSNIKVRPDGTVKVLDFGLAKALDPSPNASDVSQLSTITSPAITGMGVILGTAAYMSPEQAKGKPIDKRTDIWAFGCVLYEMLTGRRAFAGEDIAEVLARIIERDPDFAALPRATPPSIRRLLRRCLEKDRRKRLADIADAQLEFQEGFAIPPADAWSAAAIRASSPRRTVAGAGLIALAAAALAGAGVWVATRPAPARVTRTTITTSGAAALAMNRSDRDQAITPDGSRVVYVGSNSTQIFVRALDQLEPTPLAGLGTPRGLFMSPDGQWIGFFDGTAELKKVAITGGPAVTLCRVTGASRGATWGADGTIIFATNAAPFGLWRVSAAGGEPTVLTQLHRERGEVQHLYPEFLPDGQAVLFTIGSTGGPNNAQIAVLDLRSGTQKVLVQGGRDAHYLPTGHLVYRGVAGTLLTVAFDLERLEVVGTPVPVLDQVLSTPTGGADIAVAGNGTLVYVTGGAQPLVRTLVWVDRQGHEEAIKAPARAYTYPRLSPDGTRAALDITQGDDDIWIWDFVRATLTRFTFDPGLDHFPVWAPDGRRVIFSSNRAGAASLFWQAADGTGAAERLTESKTDRFPTAISPDGTRVLSQKIGT